MRAQLAAQCGAARRRVPDRDPVRGPSRRVHVETFPGPEQNPERRSVSSTSGRSRPMKVRQPSPGPYRRRRRLSARRRSVAAVSRDDDGDGGGGGGGQRPPLMKRVLIIRRASLQFAQRRHCVRWCCPHAASTVFRSVSTVVHGPPDSRSPPPPPLRSSSSSHGDDYDAERIQFRDLISCRKTARFRSLSRAHRPTDRRRRLQSDRRGGRRSSPTRQLPQQPSNHSRSILLTDVDRHGHCGRENGSSCRRRRQWPPCTSVGAPSPHPRFTSRQFKFGVVVWRILLPSSPTFGVASSAATARTGSIQSDIRGTAAAEGNIEEPCGDCPSTRSIPSQRFPRAVGHLRLPFSRTYIVQLAPHDGFSSSSSSIFPLVGRTLPPRDCSPTESDASSVSPEAAAFKDERRHGGSGGCMRRRLLQRGESGVGVFARADDFRSETRIGMSLFVV